MITSFAQYKIAVALAALAVAFSTGYYQGASGVRDKWDVERLAVAQELATLRAEAEAATSRVVTEYVDRVQVIRERGQTIIREVPTYVPADSCALPAGFRVLHDAAAASTIPDPAGIADAGAVPAADAATTVTKNYNTCHEVRAQLIALQEWVRSQQGAARDE